MSRRIRRSVVAFCATIIVLVVTAAAFELASLAYLTLRDGRYVPAADRLAKSRNTFVDDIRNDRDCHYIDSLFPHPYLAFVHHANPPCGISYINNIGLFGADFSNRKRTDRFVVLVTGGSVAAQFTGLHPNGPKYLESILNERYRSPTGKPFLVLNGGDGAWKQPQQAILFLLYADVVNAVVTLDGFNESHALHRVVKADLRFEYPSNNFNRVNPLARSDVRAVMAKWSLSWLYEKVLGSMVLRNSHAVVLFVKAAETALSHVDAAGDKETTIRSLFALPDDWTEGDRKRWGIAQYRKYIRLLDAMAREFDVRAEFFIQPVPALAKPLTPEEKAVAGDLSYGRVYAEMVGDLLDLESEGIHIHSLVGVFEGNHETLYADQVHLKRGQRGKSEGYRLIAEAMARDLADSWRLERKR